ncbi:MAG: SH3 domain-containing protein [Gammaproteobacteria bacterium]
MSAFCCLTPEHARAQEHERVTVADAFVELRTGPGRGFPIFHVAERGEQVEILKRRTDWFRLRTESGREGWVDRAQMERTLTEAGVRKSFRDVVLENYLARRLEIGFGAGDFDGDPVLTMRSSLRLTDHYLAELSLSQVAGTFSSSTLYHANLLVQPFPEWRFSPYFTLGVGRFENEPKVVLVDTEEIDGTAANSGVGVRIYLSRRFLARVDYKYYVATVDIDGNEEFQELVAGFSFFF